ncbi:MAG: hypothetical protein R2715_11395 [Ilumatobacteraceae bacterium]
MTDLVGDVPAGARRRGVPRLLGDLGDHGIERLVFGGEFGEQIGKVHGRSPADPRWRAGYGAIRRVGADPTGFTTREGPARLGGAG